MYKYYIKRIIDLVVSSIAFTLLSPIFIVLTIALTIANKETPFFIQMRPGKDERLFKLFKFKSMNDKRDNLGNLLPDTNRLTPVGKLIRKTSLDEIPQLINVIIGDMSLIGPRPLLIRYLPYYSEIEKLRHSVKPGITGWAQVNGRNFLSWEKRLEADIYYVKNLSFKLDLTIVVKTLKSIFSGKDIILDQGSYMNDFDIERQLLSKKTTLESKLFDL